MALTVEQCERIIEHELGGPPASQLSILDIVNEAGEFLAYSHTWKWLERLPALLNLVAAQEYVTLPADFQEMISLRPTNGLTRSFRWTTLDALNEMRVHHVGGQVFGFFGAILHPLPTGATEPGPPVVALWPTPTTNETGALTLIYRSGWERKSADGTAGGFIRVPKWFEPCYIECLRAWARGRDAAEAAPMAEQLVTFKLNPIYQDAVIRDGLQQGALGYMQGGAAESEYTGVQGWCEGTVLGP